jgi:hypothetical protein
MNIRTIWVHFMLRGVVLILICAGFIYAQVGPRWIYTYNKQSDYMDEAKAVIYDAYYDAVYAVGGTRGFAFWYYDYFTVIGLDASDGYENWKYFHNVYSNTPYGCAYDVVHGEYGSIYAAGISRRRKHGNLQPKPCTTFVFDTLRVGKEGRPRSGSDKNDFTVVKLNPYDGNEIWDYQYPYGCAYCAAYNYYDGGVYAAGYESYYSVSCILVVSLDTNGKENWVYAPGYEGYVKDIVFGEDGNIYVVATIEGESYDYDIAIICLDYNGNENWIQQYDGNGYEMDYYDEGRSIVFGEDWNIYAAGRLVEYTGPDFTVISLNTSGGENWVYKYDGPGDYWDEAFSVDFGDDGNIYAAGNSCEMVSGHWDLAFTVISLNQSGSQNWVYTLLGPEGGDNCANSVVYGFDNNIYAAGRSTFDSSFWYDFTVVSLSNVDGIEQWKYNFNGTANHVDEGLSIVYGEDGYVYAAGYNTDEDNARDFTVISLPEWWE